MYEAITDPVVKMFSQLIGNYQMLVLVLVLVPVLAAVLVLHMTLVA
jgi:hypothetical protein